LASSNTAEIALAPRFSNCLNGGQVYVLTQFNSKSLHRHIAALQELAAQHAEPRTGCMKSDFISLRVEMPNASFLPSHRTAGICEDQLRIWQVRVFQHD